MSGDQVNLNTATINVKKMSLGMQVQYSQYKRPELTLSGEFNNQQQEIFHMKQSHETANTLKIAMETANAIEQRAAQIKQELERAQFAMKPIREQNMQEQRSMNPMVDSQMHGNMSSY